LITSASEQRKLTGMTLVRVVTANREEMESNKHDSNIMTGGASVLHLLTNVICLHNFSKCDNVLVAFLTHTTGYVEGIHTASAC